MTDGAEVALRREMTRVGGALYVSGGALVIAAVLAAGERMASPGATAVVAAVALATGLGLWLVGERVPVPVEVHLATSALGSVVVSIIVVFAGEATAGLFGIFYVYVAAFAFYYFTLSWAIAQAAFAGVAYAVAVAVLDLEAGLGAWLVAMGATVTSGALIGLLGHRQRDVARAERERAAALAAYDAARGTLLRIVSHDLRGPLGTISLSAQTMLNDLDDLDRDVLEQLLSGQHRQAERLIRLVNDVLDQERLASGTLQPSWSDVEVRTLIRNVTESLPSGAERIEVSGDAALRVDPVFLERALDNLLSNALRHSPDGQPIEVRVVESSEDVEIVVDDRGPGVSDEHKATIFEPFVSHDGTGRSPGLGLSVTRALIRSHGGEVSVHDRPGGGARFVLTLPRGTEDPPDRPQRP